MNYGVDVTRPVQLRPNGPDKRTEYAVPGRDGFLHVVTASVWRYEGGFEPVGTLNVHIGCGVLVTDTVREGESEWDAIRRVVTTWQREQREADHVEALAMVAAPAAPKMVIGQPFAQERYPMRGHRGRPSDMVTNRSRMINGKRFDFSRITWGDTGETTLRVFEGGKTTVLHEWTISR